MDAEGRPIIDGALSALCQAVCEANPDGLAHVDASRIVFVAGAARRAARASIRPLTLGGQPPVFRLGDWEKPKIWIDGRLALYEICLRPRYFLHAEPSERLRILAHELWHVDQAFDGTLDKTRRHGPYSAEDTAVDRWVGAWRRAGARGGAVVDHQGEVRLNAWTERPPSRLGPTGRRRFSQADLHRAIVVQR